MVGSCILPHVVHTSAKVAFAISMTSVPGCVGNIKMTSVNLMNPSKQRALISSQATCNSRSIVASVSRTGKSASNSSPRRYIARCSATSLVLGLGIALLIGAKATAQDATLQSHIHGAVGVLQQLDTLASACLTGLQQTPATATNPNPNCAQFIAAIDGELLAQYIAHCEVLAAWRASYVTTAFETTQNATAAGQTPSEIARARSEIARTQSEIARTPSDIAGTPSEIESPLQLLVGAEYACGENALQARTGFVTAAFAQLQQNATAIQQEHAGLTRRLNESQFDATLSAERRLLQNSVQQQQLQRQQESERQLQQLENEIIRQQRILQ